MRGGEGRGGERRRRDGRGKGQSALSRKLACFSAVLARTRASSFARLSSSRCLLSAALCSLCSATFASADLTLCRLSPISSSIWRSSSRRAAATVSSQRASAAAAARQASAVAPVAESSCVRSSRTEATPVSLAASYAAQPGQLMAFGILAGLAVGVTTADICAIRGRIAACAGGPLAGDGGKSARLAVAGLVHEVSGEPLAARLGSGVPPVCQANRIGLARAAASLRSHEPRARSTWSASSGLAAACCSSLRTFVPAFDIRCSSSRNALRLKRIRLPSTSAASCGLAAAVGCANGTPRLSARR